MSVAVIGLGNIGIEIGVRLAAQLEVVGVDLDEQRRREWESRSGHTALQTLDEVACRDIGRVFIIVRSSSTAMSLAAAVTNQCQAGTVCHVMTTLNHEDARSLVDLTLEKDVRVLEQPISGGAHGARSGTLSILSAGPSTETDDVFIRAHLAKSITNFPHYGQPTLVKLINNTVAAYHLGADAWALEAADAAGIPAETMHEVLQQSSGASTIGSMAVRMAPAQGELLSKDVALLVAAIGNPPPITAHGRAPERALAAIRAALRSAGEP